MMFDYRRAFNKVSSAQYKHARSWGHLLWALTNSGLSLSPIVFLRLEPDTSVALTRVRIKSPTRTPGFRYNIYFAFAVGFGHVAKPHDFVDRFEDTIVRYFERDHAEGITEVAEGELALSTPTTE